MRKDESDEEVPETLGEYRKVCAELENQLAYKEIEREQHAALIHHLTAEIESCPCKAHHDAETERHKRLTIEALGKAAANEG